MKGNFMDVDSFIRLLSLTKRGVKNYFGKRPFCVSFEITHDCNAHCKHCHRGGTIDTNRATPEEFAQRFQELKPLVIQISGGEPLLRKDVFSVIEALKQPNGIPYIIFVTNAALLTKEKYFELMNRGVDAFSISLDYPDERHDEFRKIPGLFNHLKTLCKDIGSDNTITLNSVVHHYNFRDMMKLAECARDWNVSLNFSPYTWLRTQDMSFMIPKEEMPEFRAVIDDLLSFKRNCGTVRTTDSFFDDMVEFFTTESIPGCRAGERFLVVNPDGTMSPCGLIMADYPGWKELKNGFTKNNTCSFCHTCIRSSTEKPFNNLIRGGLKSIFVD